MRARFEKMLLRSVLKGVAESYLKGVDFGDTGDTNLDPKGAILSARAPPHCLLALTYPYPPTYSAADTFEKAPTAAFSESDHSL